MNLLINGSFETGDLTGWDVHYGDAKVSSKGLSVDYSTVNANQPQPQIVGPSYSFSGLGHVFNASDGNKMVLINDLIGGEHATCIHQTVTLPPDFKSDCGFVSFKWFAVLVGSNHAENERPRFVFDVNYKKNGEWRDFIEATFYSPEVQNGNWQDIAPSGSANSVWVREGEEVRSLAGLLAGDEVRIRFVAIDCPHSQHGGAAIIDNVVLANGCDGPPKTITYEDPLPNVVTPNGDGTNDVWGIRNLHDACAIEFELFDRWGDRIFFHKQTSYNGVWPTLTPIWNGKVRSRRRKIGNGLRKTYVVRKVRNKDTNAGVLYYNLKLTNCDQTLDLPGFFHVFV